MSFHLPQYWLHWRVKQCIYSRVVNTVLGMIFICHADTLPLLCQDKQCDAHKFLSTVFEFTDKTSVIRVCNDLIYTLWFMSCECKCHNDFLLKSKTGSGTQCFCSCDASNITLVFSEVRCKEWREITKNTTFTSSVVCGVSKHSLCCYLHTICHPFLLAGGMFSTCARSLAAVSRDLHMYWTSLL